MSASKLLFKGPGRVCPGCGARKDCAVLSGAEIAAERWAARGKPHRLTVWELVAAALRSATLARLERWADIEMAARLGDKATGLEKNDSCVGSDFT